MFDVGAQTGGQLAQLCGQGASRDQLFAAFQSEIDSPGALTVAAIEDVHWADEATVDLLSFLGRREESDRTAEQAVRVLEALPPGPELAWAYANLAASIFESGRTDEGLRVMEQARDLGERQGRADIVSYALNGIGLGLVESGRDGVAVLERALQVGLDADLQERPAVPIPPWRKPAPD